MIKIYDKNLQTLWQDKDIFSEVSKLSGETYRKMNNRHTFATTIAGKNYFVKHHHGVGWKEIYKNLRQFRKPVLSAKDEWHAITRLHELGVATMTTAVFGIRGNNPAKIDSFLITEALENTISLEDYCGDWLRQRPTAKLKWRLIKKVAEIARRLHQNGINHRDMYICHFLFERSLSEEVLINENFNVYLIDLHRAQIRDKTPRRWIIKDLSSIYFSVMDLGLTKRDLLRFIRSYTNSSPTKHYQKK